MNGVDISKTWKFALNPNLQSLSSLISFLLPRALLLGGIIFFGLIIFAGFQFFSSAGSDDAQAKMKWSEILTYGIIGLIIIFGAFWVLQIINVITNGALGGIL